MSSAGRTCRPMKPSARAFLAKTEASVSPSGARATSPLLFPSLPAGHESQSRLTLGRGIMYAVHESALEAAATHRIADSGVKLLLHEDQRMTNTTEANSRMQRPLSAVDPAIAGLLRDEAQREATGLELIPSENLVSEAVLEAMGSVFTNKYAEGYPGKRYYGGCEFADKVEQQAIDRAKELFGAEHAN